MQAGSKEHIDWKDGVLLAGVVACVINAVQAFFLGWMWIGYSSLFAGSVLVCASYYVVQYSDSVDLQQAAQRLHQDNQRLQEINRQFVEKTRSLEQESARLDALQKQWKELVGQMNQSASLLHASNQGLYQQADLMGKYTSQLQAENKGLQNENLHLDRMAQQLQSQEQEAERQNKELLQTTKTMQEQLELLDKEKVALRDQITVLKEEFQSHLGLLEKKIKEAGDENARIQQGLQEGGKVLKGEMDDFQSASESLQAVGEQVRAGIKALNGVLAQTTESIRNQEFVKTASAQSSEIQRLIALRESGQ
jgi:chromosome segregation ATPase